MRISKSQLTEEPSIQKTRTYHRRYSHPKTKKKSQRDRRRGTWHNKINCIPSPGRQPKTEGKLHHRSSPTGVKFLSPSGSLSWRGFCHQEEEPPEYLKASRSWSQEFYRLGRNRRLHFVDHTKSHVHWNPGQKQWLKRNLRQI